MREESQTTSFRPFSPLQRGDSFVTEDCSQRCTCARSGVLLCEPLSCRAGEICTLGNLTRGCFRGEPRPPWGFKLPPLGGVQCPVPETLPFAVGKLDRLIPFFPPFSGGPEGVNSCSLPGTVWGLFLA